MIDRSQRITPFLWFDHQAEEAVDTYTAIFKNSEVASVTRYGKQSAKAAGMPEGTVMTIAFRLDGQNFVALNGGPHFKFSEAVSFVVTCSSQEEIDYYWDRLSEGGDPKARQCGWLKDKFGLSWQVVPAEIGKFMDGRHPEKAEKVMEAVLKMKKLDLETMRRAYDQA